MYCSGLMMASLLAQGLQLTAAALNELANFVIHLSASNGASNFEAPMGYCGQIDSEARHFA